MFPGTEAGWLARPPAGVQPRGFEQEAQRLLSRLRSLERSALGHSAPVGSFGTWVRSPGMRKWPELFPRL
jgi:hypothetical protein